MSVFGLGDWFPYHITSPPQGHRYMFGSARPFCVLEVQYARHVRRQLEIFLRFFSSSIERSLDVFMCSRALSAHYWPGLVVFFFFWLLVPGLHNRGHKDFRSGLYGFAFLHFGAPRVGRLGHISHPGWWFLFVTLLQCTLFTGLIDFSGVLFLFFASSTWSCS